MVKEWSCINCSDGSAWMYTHSLMRTPFALGYQPWVMDCFVILANCGYRCQCSRRKPDCYMAKRRKKLSDFQVGRAEASATRSASLPRMALNWAAAALSTG